MADAEPMFAEILRQKAGYATGLRFPWQRALLVLRQARLPDDACLRAVEAALTPGSLVGLATLLKTLENPAIFWTELLAEVDESDWSLGDWMASIEVLVAWQKTHGKRAGPGDVIAYISCCAASGATSASGPSPARIVEKMLEEFGFDAAE